MGKIHLRPPVGEGGGRRRGDAELRRLARAALKKNDLDEVVRLYKLSNSYKKYLTILEQDLDGYEFSPNIP